MKKFDVSLGFLKTRIKTPLDKAIDAILWEVVEPPEKVSGIPFVTHEGKLQLGSFSITIYQLSDGRRVFPEGELEKIFSLEKTPEK